MNEEQEKQRETFYKSLSARCSPSQVATWFSDIKRVEIKAGEVTLKVPNAFSQGWIAEHYASQIQEAAKTAGLSFSGNSAILLDPSIASLPCPSDSPSRTAFTGRKNPNQGSFVTTNLGGSLNTFYTFANYIPGVNETAVAQLKSLSPPSIFIFAPPGQGKTHLLQALCHEMEELSPEEGVRNFLYLGARSYVDGFIKTVTKANETRNKFIVPAYVERHKDVGLLCLDGFDAIPEGAKASQRSLADVIGNRLDFNKPTIIAGNLSLSEQRTLLIPELASKTEGFTTFHLGYQNVEALKGIIQSFSARYNPKMQIPSPIVEYLAARYAEADHSSLRHLNGIVTTLLVYSSSQNKPIDHRLVDLILREARPLKEKDASPLSKIEATMKAVASYYGIKVDALAGRSKAREFSGPRQMCAYLLSQQELGTQATIARILGLKDHSTIASSIKRVKRELRAEDPQLVQDYASLQRQLGMNYTPSK